MTKTKKNEPPRDFLAEAQAATAALEVDRFRSVHALRELEEAWARSLLRLPAKADIAKAVASRAERGLVRKRARQDERIEELVSAREAAGHLARAEKWQWEIGTWATGSGEGLVSMGEVRSLQVARAFLSVALASEEVALAGSLTKQVEEDPNGMGKPHGKALRAIRAALARLGAERAG